MFSSVMEIRDFGGLVVTEKLRGPRNVHPHRLAFLDGNSDEFLVGGFEGTVERGDGVRVGAAWIRLGRNSCPRVVLQQHERQGQVCQTRHMSDMLTRGLEYAGFPELRNTFFSRNVIGC